MQQNSDTNNHSKVASPTSEIMSNMVPGRPRRQQQAYRRANTSLTLMSTGAGQQGPSGGNTAHRCVFIKFSSSHQRKIVTSLKIVRMYSSISVILIFEQGINDPQNFSTSAILKRTLWCKIALKS